MTAEGICLSKLEGKLEFFSGEEVAFTGKNG